MICEPAFVTLLSPWPGARQTMLPARWDRLLTDLPPSQDNHSGGSPITAMPARFSTRPITSAIGTSLFSLSPASAAATARAGSSDVLTFDFSSTSIPYVPPIAPDAEHFA